MYLWKRLLRNKDLYYKNKKDIRYLKQAILDLAQEHKNAPEYTDHVLWVCDEVNAEFEKKSHTQQKNEEIGALVAHVVYHGADVLPTIKAIAEWFLVSETVVRDGYYKIRNTFDFDPKDASDEKWANFLVKHAYVPLTFVREQFNRKRLFPGTGSESNHEHYKVWKAMIAAHDQAVSTEKMIKEMEQDFLIKWTEPNTQK